LFNQIIVFLISLYILSDLKNGGNSVPDLPTELATEMFTKGKVGDHVKVKLMTGVDKGLFNIRDTKGIILSGDYRKQYKY
jgi:hypothetical protein